jgi:hypothetical protein
MTTKELDLIFEKREEVLIKQKKMEDQEYEDLGDSIFNLNERF